MDRLFVVAGIVIFSLLIVPFCYGIEALHPELLQTGFVMAKYSGNALFPEESGYYKGEPEQQQFQYKLAVSERNLSIMECVSGILLLLISFMGYYLYIQRREWKRQTLIYTRMQEQRKQELDLSAMKHQQEMSKREQKLVLFRSSALYYKISVSLSAASVQKEDFQQLEKSIDQIYTHFRKNLRKLSPSLPLTQWYICYLTAADVRLGRIAELLNVKNISVERRRLYSKLTGKAGSATDFDELIKQICE